MTGAQRGEAPEWLDVSRETLDRLVGLLALVEKWNPAINLVAAASLQDGWNRHIIDSAQLMAFVPPDAHTWADFGSGAGFPGLVIAILAAEQMPDLRITLVESDKRKAAFLTQAARQLGLTVRVLTERAGTLNRLNADVISARALAPLPDLCALAQRHLAPNGVAVFPKGAQAEVELAGAARSWRFQCEMSESHTDPAGRVIILKNGEHA
jgi:16S rRNA (guanine527-N7)-methyltransferase